MMLGVFFEIGIYKDQCTYSVIGTAALMINCYNLNSVLLSEKMLVFKNRNTHIHALLEIYNDTTYELERKKSETNFIFT